MEVSQEYVEKLFAHIHADLGSRTEAKDDFRFYNQLNMARLIRQLLVDGNHLFQQANRQHRLRIRFIRPRLGPAPADLEKIPSIYSLDDYSVNDLPPDFYLHPLKINEFLSHSPITLAGQAISIIEIIKYVANQYGGVHLAPSLQGETNLLIARFDSIFRVAGGGGGIVLAQIDQIARDTLIALGPLMKVIQEKYIALDR